MKKTLVIILICLTIIGAGAAAWWFFVRDDSSSQNSESGVQGTTSSIEQAGFAPVTTEGLSYEATVTTKQGTEQIAAKIATDGQGNTEYTAMQSGQEMRLVFTEDYYYTCNEGQACYKFAVTSSEQVNVDPKQYDFTEADVKERISTIEKQGQELCPAGTCQVWVAKNNETGEQIKIFVDTNTNRVSEIQSTSGDTMVTIAYNYKTVDIAVPLNAQELPAGI